MGLDPGETADPAVTELNPHSRISRATLLSAVVLPPDLFYLHKSEPTMADALQYSLIQALHWSLGIW